MKITFCLLMLLTSNAFAIDTSSLCGEFDVFGSAVRNSKGETHYIVNPKSLSEVVFRLTNEQTIKLTPYVGDSTKIRAVIVKKIDGKNGVLSEIKKIEVVAPDPAMTTNRHGFHVVTPGKCE